MTANTAAPLPTTWTVTGQVAKFAADPTGKPVNGVEISFTTTAGNSGTVFIPNTSFNVANAQAAIAARAAILDAVSNLTGP